MMDWKQKLQSARESGQTRWDHMMDVCMQEHWPKIQLLFEEKFGPAVLAAAHNDPAMQQLFKMVYTMLPFPVRMLVNEGAFVSFCLLHRDKLLPSTGTRIATP
jgi:hypothetical protein